MPYRDLKAVALTTQPSRLEAASGQRDLSSPTHLINGFYDPINSSPAFVQNRKKEGHRLLEHTTDAYIDAWGPTLERAFALAAEGFYETLLNHDKIDPHVEMHVN